MYVNKVQCNNCIKSKVCMYPSDMHALGQSLEKISLNMPSATPAKIIIECTEYGESVATPRKDVSDHKFLKNSLENMYPDTNVKSQYIFSEKDDGGYSGR